MQANEVIRTLNELIQTSEDGMKGFEQASRRATEPTLRSELYNRAHLCEKAAQELRALVRSLGGEPLRDGSLQGAAHRGWVAVKATFGDSDLAVLDEVERGEDHARLVYVKALAQDLPAPVRTLVEDQYQGVVGNHERIRDLRDSYKRVA